MAVLLVLVDSVFFLSRYELIHRYANYNINSIEDEGTGVVHFLGQKVVPSF